MQARTIGHWLHRNSAADHRALPERIAVAAGAALEEGLAVWFSPFPCNLTPNQLERQLVEAAADAWGLRTPGMDWMYVMGCGITQVQLKASSQGTTRCSGCQPHMDPNALVRAWTSPGRCRRPFHGSSSPWRRAGARDAFTGPLTYASAAWQPADGILFHLAAVDHYLDASNRVTTPTPSTPWKANGQARGRSKPRWVVMHLPEERTNAAPWAKRSSSSLLRQPAPPHRSRRNGATMSIRPITPQGHPRPARGSRRRRSSGFMVGASLRDATPTRASPRPRPRGLRRRRPQGAPPPTSDAPTTLRWEPQQAFRALAERDAPAYLRAAIMYALAGIAFIGARGKDTSST